MSDYFPVHKRFPTNLHACSVRLRLQKLKHSGARETVFLLPKCLRRAHERCVPLAVLQIYVRVVGREKLAQQHNVTARGCLVQRFAPTSTLAFLLSL